MLVAPVLLLKIAKITCNALRNVVSYPLESALEGL